MIQYFLAFVLLGALDSAAPELHSPHKTLEDCSAARLVALRENQQLLSQKAVVDLKGTFVCLKMEPTT